MAAATICWLSTSNVAAAEVITMGRDPQQSQHCLVQYYQALYLNLQDIDNNGERHPTVTTLFSVHANFGDVEKCTNTLNKPM